MNTHNSSSKKPSIWDPAPPQPQPQPAPQPNSRTRVGHIARLPKALRDLVNHMLDDGKTYQDILDELEKHRDQWPPDITALAHHHLVSWRSGGYQDWLFHQEQLAQLRAKEEFALDFATETDTAQLHRAGLRLAFLRLIQALHQTNISGCENLASLRPASYAALLASINRLSRSALAFSQFNHVLEEDARQRATAKEYREGGISDEAWAEIDAKFGLNEDPPPKHSPDPNGSLTST